MSTLQPEFEHQWKIIIQGSVIYPLQERTLSDFRFSKAIAVTRSSTIRLHEASGCLLGDMPEQGFRH